MHNKYIYFIFILSVALQDSNHNIATSIKYREIIFVLDPWRFYIRITMKLSHRTTIALAASCLVTQGRAATADPFESRSLQFRTNEVCNAENSALTAQRLFMDASRSVMEDCALTSGEETTSDTFLYNYADCSAASDFTASCSAAGGKILYYNVRINCSNGDGIDIQIGANNVPECVGKSCNSGRLSMKNDAAFKQVEKELEDVGFTCGVTGCTPSVAGGVESVDPTMPSADMGEDVETSPASQTQLPTNDKEEMETPSLLPGEPTMKETETVNISFNASSGAGGIFSSLWLGTSIALMYLYQI